ncbi:hypothetical protein K2D_22660 [Planctomycetes bacterium K2D]|uniref:PEP-CTERM protein-sorting domain-containing protein n=2 Tax=Botrimarina mediterranea TaxID=2528022 RepID=A0A518K8B2_9BACT|nr:hypothetical protein Spa11_22280 [Botrimarina mediterranea]QDV78659.1 hypothetical protein K2D_22660 [Planctomycetes bacterium K2D]
MQLIRMIRQTTAAAFLLNAIALPAAVCCGETTETWTGGADIDAWVYTNNDSGSGSRFQSPTFTDLSIDPETNQFVRGNATGASRLGMALMAFQTSDQIAPANDPTRYRIESVKVTAWARRAPLSSGDLLYTDQPLSHIDLLTEAQSGNVSSQKPFELFGVGFRDGYEGFDLGNASGDLLYSEASEPYSGEGGSYIAYPIAGDGEGQYIDVSNSYTGGFSATSPTEQTDPFTAAPWAIGKTAAAVGSVLAGNINFTFELDLSLPGVAQYVQESLSDGSIGFMLSSMHRTGVMGQSGGAYPEWRMREGASGQLFASLAIEYSLLAIPGDYDGNGFVEQADYDVWSQAYGSTVTPSTGADGNGDGFIDAADYSVWRDAFAGSPVLAVPEPTACLTAILALANLSLLRRPRTA